MIIREMPTKTVSIIIRCFNEVAHIGKLLTGIEKQDYPNIEIIIVDSGSNDGTVEICQKFNTTIISILPEDFSFGYALNKGCEAATGDILLFASAHVYPVYTNWVSLMAKPFENDKVALTYGGQIGNELTKFSEHMIFRKWFPETSVKRQNHPFCNNANCAVRKNLWLVQNYDEQLTGLEDLDWANKILKKGYHIAYQADAKIVHVHEETPKRVFNRYKREAIAIKNIFPEQKFTLIEFLKLFIGNTFSDYISAIKQGVFFKNILEIPVFRFMHFWGTYKGYRHKGKVNDILHRRFYYPNGISENKNHTTVVYYKIDYDQIA